jgi:hypothetical protein
VEEQSDAPEFAQAPAACQTQSLDELSSRPTWHRLFMMRFPSVAELWFLVALAHQGLEIIIL